MKNNVNLKKYLTICVIIFIIFMIAFIIINSVQYIHFTKNANSVINQMVAEIQEKYPDVNINDIIKILNSDNIDADNVLREYGISLEKDSAIMQNTSDYIMFLILSTGIIILLFLSIIVIFILYQKKQNKKINEITKYIEEINNHNYALDIQENSEDELSILKNELYKITVTLKEQAENSKEDKIRLKKSLEDISHQLKTPLTFITIMLDNILDNPNMDIETRNGFIKDIYREITNINFFVQSLLKLSKFDADTITFNDKMENLKDIIDEAVKNVSILCDLKNVEIIVTPKGEENISKQKEKTYSESNIQKQEKIEKKSINKETKKSQAFCDLKWQVEAVTNIIKNSVEHSKENSKVYISYDENSMYSEIMIKDEGAGIDKEDLKHIFERFYKAKNSSKDSVGIGLALAKTIVEKDNGYITVDSEISKGTTFYIKYLK